MWLHEAGQRERRCPDNLATVATMPKPIDYDPPDTAGPHLATEGHRRRTGLKDVGVSVATQPPHDSEGGWKGCSAAAPRGTGADLKD